MLLDPSLLRRCRWAAVIFLLIASSFVARAEFLEKLEEALSISDSQNRFSMQLSGLVDLETYFIDQPASGLIFSDRDFLFNPRLTLYLDTKIGSHIYFFAQTRVDRGFDPTDGGARMRLNEYFLRYRPGKSSHINFQIGQFATVVGNWVSRHDSWQNPFINAPLPYENLTGIWDSAAPGETATLLSWAHAGENDSGDYSDKNLRVPIIWGPSYASGVAVFGALGRFDYAVEMKNGALSSRPEWWRITRVGLTHPTFNTRLGFRPDEMWTLGLSASSGTYLLPQAAQTLPAGRDIGDYRELVLAQDISFAWHHLQFWAECYETRFQVPVIGNADTVAYYLEAKYKITPQLFAALRWNQQLFGTIRDQENRAKWGNDIWRVDAALGYRFTNYLQGKLQYSFSRQDTLLQQGEHLLAAQLTVRF